MNAGMMEEVKGMAAEIGNAYSLTLKAIKSHWRTKASTDVYINFIITGSRSTC